MAINKYGLATTRGGVAWALHEWHTALRITGGSAEAESYACAADLVVDYLRDRATFAEPHQLSVGVRDVWVNGTRVLKDGTHTGATPGQFVRGPGA